MQVYVSVTTREGVFLELVGINLQSPSDVIDIITS